MIERTTLVQAKPWFKSKLNWLGIAQLVVGAAELISTTPLFEGSEVAGTASMIAGVLTIALRTVTKRPVALSEKPVEVKAPKGNY